jgi:hypothetical protein
MALVHVILLASHLLAMNVASAGPLVCVWLRSRGRRGGEAADGVGRRLAAWSLWGLIAGIVIGAILTGIAWADTNQSYWNALRRFEPQTFVFALAELAFTAACLAAYLALWNHWRGRPWLHGLLAVLAATNLLYHFPPLMIVLGQLSARPELTDAAIITRSVYRHLMVRPEVLANVLHFALASVAVTGLFVMHLALKANDGELISGGAWVALVASLAQLGVGMWVLMQLPLTARNSLVGDDWLASGLFVWSIAAALGLMHALSAVAMGETSHATVWRSTLLMLAVIVLMAGTLARSRRIEAGGAGQLSKVGTVYHSFITLQNSKGGLLLLDKT